MAAAVIVTSPAGPPTPECPIWLQANEAIVTYTQQFIDWQAAPADAAGEVLSPEVARSPPEDWLYSKGSIKLAKHAHAPVTKPDETATSARAHQTDRRHVGGLALRLPIHGWVCVSIRKM